MSFGESKIGEISGIGGTNFVTLKPEDDKIATKPLLNAIGNFLNGSMGVDANHGGASSYTAQGSSNSTNTMA